MFLLFAFWRLAFLFLQCVDFGFVFAFGSVRLSAPGFWFRAFCSSSGLAPFHTCSYLLTPYLEVPYWSKELLTSLGKLLLV